MRMFGFVIILIASGIALLFISMGYLDVDDDGHLFIKHFRIFRWLLIIGFALVIASITTAIPVMRDCDSTLRDTSVVEYMSMVDDIENDSVVGGAEYYTCGYCGSLISYGDNFCSTCGARLDYYIGEYY